MLGRDLPITDFYTRKLTKTLNQMHGPFLTSLGKAAPESLQVLVEGCADLLAGGQVALDVAVLPLRGCLRM